MSWNTASYPRLEPPPPTHPPPVFSYTVCRSLNSPAVRAAPASLGSSSSSSSTSSSSSWSSSSSSFSSSTTCSCSSSSWPSWPKDSLLSAGAASHPPPRPRETESCWKSLNVNAACAKRSRLTGVLTKACASRIACPSSLVGEGHLSLVRLARHPARDRKPSCGTQQSEEESPAVSASD